MLLFSGATIITFDWDLFSRLRSLEKRKRKTAIQVVLPLNQLNPLKSSTWQIVHAEVTPLLTQLLTPEGREGRKAKEENNSLQRTDVAAVGCCQAC